MCVSIDNAALDSTWLKLQHRCNTVKIKQKMSPRVCRIMYVNNKKNYTSGRYGVR